LINVVNLTKLMQSQELAGIDLKKLNDIAQNNPAFEDVLKGVIEELKAKMDTEVDQSSTTDNKSAWPSNLSKEPAKNAGKNVNGDSANPLSKLKTTKDLELSKTDSTPQDGTKIASKESKQSEESKALQEHVESKGLSAEDDVSNNDGEKRAILQEDDVHDSIKGKILGHKEEGADDAVKVVKIENEDLKNTKGENVDQETDKEIDRGQTVKGRSKYDDKFLQTNKTSNEEIGLSATTRTENHHENQVKQAMDEMQTQAATNSKQNIPDAQNSIYHQDSSLGKDNTTTNRTNTTNTNKTKVELSTQKAQTQGRDQSQRADDSTQQVKGKSQQSMPNVQNHSYRPDASLDKGAVAKNTATNTTNTTNTNKTKVELSTQKAQTQGRDQSQRTDDSTQQVKGKSEKSAIEQMIKQVPQTLGRLTQTSAESLKHIPGNTTNNASKKESQDISQKTSEPIQVMNRYKDILKPDAEKTIQATENGKQSNVPILTSVLKILEEATKSRQVAEDDSSSQSQQKNSSTGSTVTTDKSSTSVVDVSKGTPNKGIAIVKLVEVQDASDNDATMLIKGQIDTRNTENMYVSAVALDNGVNSIREGIVVNPEVSNTSKEQINLNLKSSEERVVGFPNTISTFSSTFNSFVEKTNESYLILSTQVLLGNVDRAYRAYIDAEVSPAPTRLITGQKMSGEAKHYISGTSESSKGILDIAVRINTGIEELVKSIRNGNSTTQIGLTSNVQQPVYVYQQNSVNVTTKGKDSEKTGGNKDKISNKEANSGAFIMSELVKDIRMSKSSSSTNKVKSDQLANEITTEVTKEEVSKSSQNNQSYSESHKDVRNNTEGVSKNRFEIKSIRIEYNEMKENRNSGNPQSELEDKPRISNKFVERLAELSYKTSNTKSSDSLADPIEQSGQTDQANDFDMAERLQNSRNLEEIYEKIRQFTTSYKLEEKVQMKLYPEQLGNLDVELKKEGKQIQIVFMTENEKAKEVIEKNSYILKDRLANLDLDIKTFEVKVKQEERYYDQEHQGQNKNQNNENSRNYDERREQEDENKKRKWVIKDDDERGNGI